MSGAPNASSPTCPPPKRSAASPASAPRAASAQSKVPSQKAAVIFENRLAGRILSPFFGGISGAAVARGVSFLKDKLGQRVFAEGFRIHEDPFVKRAMGSRWFDGEGGAVKPMKLVEDGVITTWLLNASAARQLGLEPNGHATPRATAARPALAPANLFVKPGPDDLADAR